MTPSDFVTLRSGLTLPLAALQFAWHLEERGLHMGVLDDLLTVGPRDLLTPADRDLIRRWKLHLLAIVSYSADAASQPQ
jgi:hypothetical protein